MAAFDTPLSILNEPMANPADFIEAGSSGGAVTSALPTTVAPFSPVQTSSLTSPRNTVVIHQKSPLLVATPPQVTRALAYSHPFLLPLNRLFGLISWSTGDEWESFLFLCSFWATVLYGDVLIVFAGPVLLVVGMMVAMYSRRFSPLSSHTTSASSKGHKRGGSSVVSASIGGSLGTPTKNQTSLDDIVDTLNVMTLRCNTLLEPLLKLTDFLSTQYSATSASTRPALVRLLIRMIAMLPVWIILSLPPIHLITGRKVVFVVGTLILTWHSKPARVCRTLLWRSRTVRTVSGILTGLEFPGTTSADDVAGPAGLAPSATLSRRKSQRDAANHLAHSISASSHRNPAGVRFSFTLFENQRRWIGIGWTTALLGYERAAWTDEHLNGCPSKEDFQLPKVEGSAGGSWRWVPGSEWHVEALETEGELKSKKFAPSTVSLRGKGGDDEGWIYYDNNWAGGKAQDGWGRYTRRRKWVREAELVEVGEGDSSGAGGGPDVQATELPADEVDGNRTTTGRTDDASETASMRKRKGFFGRRFSNRSSNNSKKGSQKSAESISEEDEDGDKPPRRLNEEGEDERVVKKEHWEVGDDMKMALG